MCVDYEAASDVLQAQSTPRNKRHTFSADKITNVLTALSWLYQPQAGREIKINLVCLAIQRL